MHGRGIRKGLYTCPHSLTAGFIHQSNSSSSGKDWAKEGVRGMKLHDSCRVIKTDPHQTQLWAVLLCNCHQYLLSRSLVLLHSSRE